MFFRNQASIKNPQWSLSIASVWALMYYPDVFIVFVKVHIIEFGFTLR